MSDISGERKEEAINSYEIALSVPFNSLESTIQHEFQIRSVRL